MVLPRIPTNTHARAHSRIRTAGLSQSTRRMFLIDMRGCTLTEPGGGGGGGGQRITTATGNTLIDTSALGARWRSESQDGGGGGKGGGEKREQKGKKNLTPTCDFAVNSHCSQFCNFIDKIAYETQYNV